MKIKASELKVGMDFLLPNNMPVHAHSVTFVSATEFSKAHVVVVLHPNERFTQPSSFDPNDELEII